ncbi:MAG TPA: type III-A CRISPR-associated protein Cas10/Csm1 [Bacteroidia bacterium]|nr:type III-A CRISPR-associated protein Cas10/Csm1 [Bacteroidia bacterium]HRS58456.1 type III-A CRISPR-associated protein Cas10/Csm1 [Bacteroidia bacterium]
MDTIRQQIYLGALLHDIGKFYQRADNKLIRDILQNNPHLNAIAQLCCKFDESRNKWDYQHSFWTYLFYQENKNLFDSIKEDNEQIFNINPFENKGIDNLINFSIFHHKPQTKLQSIIQIADWISSGMERDDKNAENEEGIGIKNIDFGMFKYKKVPMFSLFNEIIVKSETKGNNETHDNNQKKNKQENLYSFNLNPLVVDEDSIFPQVIEKDSFKNASVNNYQKNYFKLWEEFINEFYQLPTDSFHGFSESLLYLLKKYTWCIPASTNDMVHTSLYEHMKTTAAIALCLYDYQEHEGFEKTFTWERENDYPKIKEGVYPLLMVCWDLSGIQKFIYDVSSTKASVSLKGRSFYLQLLIESVIQKTIIECNSHWGNVVYSSGGKLFMILPNLKDVRNKLKEIKNAFERLLWEEHHGKVSICLGMVEFSFDTTKDKPKKERILFNSNGQVYGSLSDLWGKTITSASEDKGQKFESLISSELFKPSGEWGNNYTLCAVTGVEGKIKDDLVLLEKDDDEKIWVTRAVKKQSEIGKTLKDADYILTYLKDDPEGNKYLDKRAHCSISMSDIGINHYLFDQKQLIDENAEFRFISSADIARVRRLNETDFNVISSLKGKRCSYGYLFYGGNIQARITEEKNNNGKTEKFERDKTFEELCWIDNNGKDKTFLGVLRMDVDGLGSIFSKGIPDDYKSFAAYSTLSFLFDLFFSGYLNTIRYDSHFKDFVNIIYSGGDDVFAVGRWDKIIEFAEKIREEFGKFTGREDICISGGIAIVGEKFPIRIAANMAGDYEDASKKYKKTGNVELDKNAITFFGETISWQYEWEEVKELKKSLKSEITENRLSKAILHQIIRWKIIKDENNKKTKENLPPDLSYRWHTAYYLKRYGDRISRGNESAKELLKKLQNGLFTGEGSFATKENSSVKFTADRYYDLAALAARWAEMEIKEKISNN